jgi:hypothetical protein
MFPVIASKMAPWSTQLPFHQMLDLSEGEKVVEG